MVVVNTDEALLRMPAGWMKFKGDVSAMLASMRVAAPRKMEPESVVRDALRKPMCASVRRF